MNACQTIFVAIVISFLTTGLSAQTETSPLSFTGFQNAGHPVFADGKLPVEWSPENGIKWQTSLAGYGQSTPVVFGDHIYVTSVSGKMKENLHVQALSVSTGKEVWQHDAANSTPEENSTYVSRAAATPVCDDDGVIAFFEGGNVVALTHDGRMRWKIDLVEQHGDVKARHSLSASLEQNAEHVFLWIERSTDPYVMAVAKESGETVWRVDGLGTTSWASPRLVSVGDSQHLVLSGIGKIAGLNPSTGERLWDFDDIGGNSTPTPVEVGDGRFLIGASPGRGESGAGNATKSNGVIEVAKSDEGFAVKWLWQAERATCSFGSPMAHKGKAYFVNRQGVVFCLNVENGEEIYAGRAPCKSVWATPIGVGDNVYLFGKEGSTTILKDADALTEVVTNELWASEQPEAKESEEKGGGGNFGGPVLYAATPIGTKLLLRRGDILYAVGE